MESYRVKNDGVAVRIAVQAFVRCQGAELCLSSIATPLIHHAALASTMAAFTTSNLREGCDLLMTPGCFWMYPSGSGGICGGNMDQRTVIEVRQVADLPSTHPDSRSSWHLLLPFRPRPTRPQRLAHGATVGPIQPRLCPPRRPLRRKILSPRQRSDRSSRRSANTNRTSEPRLPMPVAPSCSAFGALCTADGTRSRTRCTPTSRSHRKRLT